MDMKLRGMYIARQLSFKGVTFEIQEVKFDAESEKMYNDSVALVSFCTVFVFSSSFCEYNQQICFI